MPFGGLKARYSLHLGCLFFEPRHQVIDDVVNVVAICTYGGVVVLGADPDSCHAKFVCGLQIAGHIFNHDGARGVNIVIAEEFVIS